MGISQEEIVHNAQTVTKGLEALRLEHQSLLGGLLQSSKPETSDDELIALSQREKCSLLERSLEMIDLGLGEAHVMAALAGHLQAVEAEKQKLRSQVRCIYLRSSLERYHRCF
jgi:kinesin light chain